MIPCQKNFSLSFLACIILFCSCRTDEPCQEAVPILYFVSFQGTETDSLVLRKFTKGTNFATQVDSVLISKANSQYQYAGDTLHIYNSLGGDYSIDIAYDYEIYLPLAGKLFQLKDIAQQQTSISVGLSLDKQTCVNPVSSYTLNGTVVNNPGTNVIYVKE